MCTRVCMYVCVCVWMCMYVCVWLYAYMYVCMCVCMCICEYMYIFVFVYLCVWMCVPADWVSFSILRNFCVFSWFICDLFVIFHLRIDNGKHRVVSFYLFLIYYYYYYSIFEKYCENNQPCWIKGNCTAISSLKSHLTLNSITMKEAQIYGLKYEFTV